MTTAPFEPDPEFGRPRIAAADPGPGAPEQAPGFGTEGEEPDVIDEPERGRPEQEENGEG